MKDKIALVLGPLSFIIILTIFKPNELSKEGVAVLATTAWIAIWWIFEVVPIAITSLLPIILFPLTGAVNLKETASTYGHKYIFLYIGGFILAIAIQRWNLHKRIALNIIKAIGSNVKLIILGFMIATAFLSMWISNTATAVMMLPIGMAIILQLKDIPETEEDENKTFGKALMLGIAYSASIGGIATLIGTPPNLVLAGVVEELYQIEISFAKWIKLGLPISMVLLVLCWWYLTNMAFSFKYNSFPGGRQEIDKQLRKLGKVSYEEKVIFIVFIGTALAWILRSLILKNYLPNLDDTIIAIIAAFALFLLPASKEKNRTIITWEEAVKLPWGILLLFGGGLALAKGFTSSGLANWIGGQLQLFEHLPLFILVICIVTLVNFLTEITSNLATTAMLLPVLAPLALGIGVHPYLLMISATLAASCAFMLPVATPPNAVVFGSGYLKISDMVRVGIWLNLLSILIISLFVYFLLPLFWNIKVGQYPVDW